MTIATKNGSVIIKDGSVAQNCGCCGGWYCCPPAECALDVVNSIVVTITPAALEWVRKVRTRSGCSFRSFDQYTAVVPTGSVAGEHSLVKLSSTLWAKTLEVDSVGCVSPVVSIERLSFFGTSGVWRLIISHGAYYWHQRTTDSESPFKNLSDMQCQNTQNTPPSSGSLCDFYLNGFQAYRFSMRSTFPITRSFQCAPIGEVSFDTSLGFFVPTISSDEKGPPADPADTGTTTGSLQINVVVTIS